MKAKQIFLSVTLVVVILFLAGCGGSTNKATMNCILNKRMASGDMSMAVKRSK
jgi:hypothetical protein